MRFVQDSKIKLITLLSLTVLGLFLNGFANINSTLSISTNCQSEIETKIDMSRMMQMNYMFEIGVKLNNTAIMTKTASAFGNYDQCNPTGLGMITCNTSFSPKSGFVTEEYSLFKKYIIADVLAFDRQFGKWQEKRREGIKESIQKSKKISKVSSLGGSLNLTVAMPYPITKVNENKVTYAKDPNNITIDLEEEEFVNAERMLIESETDNVYGIVIVAAAGLLLIFILITGILIKQRKVVSITALFLMMYAVLILLELDGQIRFNVNGYSEAKEKSHQKYDEHIINQQLNKLAPVKNNIEDVEKRPQANFYFNQTPYITDSEYNELKKMSPEYASSELHMIQTYGKLKKLLPNDAKTLLINDQNRWIDERNQNSINADAKGSKEYLTELIRLTQDRTKELSQQLQ